MVRRVKKSRDSFQQKELLKDKLRKKHASRGPDKKITLNGIMKNEGKNVYRLLDSVKPIIDFVCITDTGSTDDTVELIYKWGEENNIPTTVCHEEFKNFSYNRTNSIKNSKRCYPEADYILLSDADFVWEHSSNFRKNLLVDHKYLISQYNQCMSYDNVRLISTKLDWKYYLRTHEYICSDQEAQGYDGYIRTARITSLRINDLEDGGCKSEKYIRDERLIREDLADPELSEDDKIRCRFYLARTLHDVQRYEEAIEAYLERCKYIGYIEEIYYSKFQIGHCYEMMARNILNCSRLVKDNEMIISTGGDIGKLPSPDSDNEDHEGEDREDHEGEILPLTEEDYEFIKKWNPQNLTWGELILKSEFLFEDADKAYWDAYQFRKTRAEALAALTRMHRELFHSQRAYDLSQIGKTIRPSTDTLFVYTEDYKDYTWDFEVSVTACYLDKMDVAREAAERLMDRSHELPPWMLEVVESNLQYYI